MRPCPALHLRHVRPCPDLHLCRVRACGTPRLFSLTCPRPLTSRTAGRQDLHSTEQKLGTVSLRRESRVRVSGSERQRIRARRAWAGREAGTRASLQAREVAQQRDGKLTAARCRAKRALGAARQRASERGADERVRHAARRASVAAAAASTRRRAATSQRRPAHTKTRPGPCIPLPTYPQHTDVQGSKSRYLAALPPVLRASHLLALALRRAACIRKEMEGCRLRRETSDGLP